jgi:hypothetical protein
MYLYLFRLFSLSDNVREFTPRIFFNSPKPIEFFRNKVYSISRLHFWDNRLKLSSRLFISSFKSFKLASWFSIMRRSVSSIPLRVCSMRASTSLRSSLLKVSRELVLLHLVWRSLLHDL